MKKLEKKYFLQNLKFINKINYKKYLLFKKIY